MSYLSELDQAGWEQRNTEELLTAREPANKAGFFQGVVKAPAMGFMRGLTNLNDALLTATDLVYPMSDEERTQQQTIRRKLTDLFTPDSRTVGTAGRVLGGVAQGIAPLVVPEVGVPAMVGTNTLAAGKEAIDQGVDSTTASGLAAIEGATSYAGVKIPIIGKTLAQRLAAGVVGNVALGAGSTEASHVLLNQRGYDELASNYDPLDVEARTVDALSGLVFGGAHHFFLPSEKAAVATLNNDKHFQKDTAPGVPADAAAQAAHNRAMETATDQLLRGEPVNVSPDVTQATFEPRPAADVPIPEDLQALDAARSVNSDAAEPPAGYDVAEGVLTDEQRAQFENLGRAGDGSVAEAGSASVLPGAAGRGSADEVAAIPAFRGSSRPLEESHFGFESLGKNTENPSSGLGVWFTKDRAEAARWGKVSEHDLHLKNPKVYDAGELPGFGSLAEAHAFQKQLIAEGHDGIILKNSQVGGHDHYVAFNPAQVKAAAARAKVAKPAKPATTPKAEPAAAKGEATVDPEVAAVREHLAAADIKIPTGDIDADGKAVTMSAREAMTQAEAEVADAEKTGQGIAAAVSCFLTRGA